MMNRMVNKEFAQEIAAVIRTAQNGDRLPELLKHYHQRDVAKAVTEAANMRPGMSVLVDWDQIGK